MQTEILGLAVDSEKTASTAVRAVVESAATLEEELVRPDEMRFHCRA